jgi:hypothetical protein
MVEDIKTGASGVLRRQFKISILALKTTYLREAAKLWNLEEAR